jgi:hypothetical protein
MTNIWRGISFYPRRQGNSSDSTAVRLAKKFNQGFRRPRFYHQFLLVRVVAVNARDPGFGNGENAGRAIDFFQRKGFQKRGSSWELDAFIDADIVQ